ncbi:MAG: transcription elongation factor GreA [Oscillospiraceae bacterium]|nr:transcription elongation factor GreA [Oscillospiraceae bacterium]MBQ2057182.1 transcription elongation factor GreA [Oscillospiraceae bacterium]MBQ2330319.1 transcription elongation factor GreA [Oscillospiraceae bacterium]MBQ3951726.1 transcription elongation factor GreA [Oscillospiraceae bacterium]MBQ3985817.1 transcription elongation factor GreA [Oscillospiraceae bacterium]
MYDELTQVDIKKMQEEIDYRERELRPKLIEEVQIARGFGDLSENFEYKAAKQEKNRNDSRIRYLKRMIATAKVIDAPETKAGEVALFSKVKLKMEDDGSEEWVHIVTTLRQNPMEGRISKESPIGRAIMGKKPGERATVRISDEYSYEVTILEVEAGADDDSIEIVKF